MTDTIVALATAPVPAGLAVLRLSGPRAHAIVAELTGLSHLRHGHMRFCALCDGETVIDRGYAVAFHAPRSFTGEDVAELQVHGSLAVVDRLMAACIDRGARMARPGEFSQRAYENGKLDLVQAEALADLISARAESARAPGPPPRPSAASRQPAPGQSNSPAKPRPVPMTSCFLRAITFTLAFAKEA